MRLELGRLLAANEGLKKQLAGHADDAPGKVPAERLHKETVVRKKITPATNGGKP